MPDHDLIKKFLTEKSVILFVWFYAFDLPDTDIEVFEANRKERGGHFLGKMTLPIFFNVLGDDTAQVFLEGVSSKANMEYI